MDQTLEDQTLEDPCNKTRNKKPKQKLGDNKQKQTAFYTVVQKNLSHLHARTAHQFYRQSQVSDYYKDDYNALEILADETLRRGYKEWHEEKSDGEQEDIPPKNNPKKGKSNMTRPKKGKNTVSQGRRTNAAIRTTTLNDKADLKHHPQA
ncbi:hypothetical protein MMC28_010964 [Mycoblastus sanguinarius]|nr:hypothetical protein [Mycoblastus sanguinarius]